MKARAIIIRDGVGFVPLGKNAKQGYALVSADDVYKVEMNSWRLDSHGYAIKSIKENGKTKNISLHHVVYKKPSKGMVIDHINRNKLDNRRENLREVSHSINSANRKINRSKDSLFRYPGVRQMKSSKTGQIYDTFEVSIKLKGKQIRTEYYNNLEDAISARKNMKRELYGFAINRDNSRRNRSSWGL